MLPPEADIAANDEVSRGVAREVIRGLEERGLVKVFHGRGADLSVHQVGHLRESAHRSPGPATERRFQQADVAFHRAIVDAAGNSALAGLIERIHTALLAARDPLARPQHSVERAIPAYERIAEAVIANDAGRAREAMRAHLAADTAFPESEIAGTDAQ